MSLQDEQKLTEKHAVEARGGVLRVQTEEPGKVIGRYKLLEKVGEGGFGIVYVAEQKEPVKRRVALKIIKLGMDTKEVVARFEAERQALALMDHPHIAKVFDAGATENGRPYFVMELVKGIKITEYCDQTNLSTTDRLKLFIQICQAIQHAHQKGIIHRDIKPSNILVTLHDRVAVPKVIDFGIAKATQQELTEKTVYTQLQQFVGTPAYMSPEQAEMSGLDIDTRSDIYSLGVLLYELLTGQTPFDGKELIKRSLDEIVRTIREVEPPKPSTKLNTLQGEELTTTAKRRACDAPKLIKLLRGDLDWVVMKCLEKDRTRRYETANGLAADLSRFLDNETVSARPPTAAYRIQKLIRRNKAATLAAAAILMALLTGVAVSTYAFFREREARLKQNEAEKARQTESVRADAVARFLDNLLRDTTPNMIAQGNHRTVRELLLTANELADSALANAPASEMLVRYRIFRAYEEMGDHRARYEQMKRIVELIPAVPEKDLVKPRNELRVRLAAARLWAGQIQEGLGDLRKLQETFRGESESGKHDLARALSHEAGWLYDNNQPSAAAPLLKEALRLLRACQGERGLKYYSANTYAKCLKMRGEWAEVERVAGDWLMPARDLPNDYYVTAQHIRMLALLNDALCAQLRFSEAAARLRAEEQDLRASACQPRDLLKLLAMKGQILARAGKGREALPVLIEAATNSLATPMEWYQAVTVAFGTGEMERYHELCRLALVRFVAGADGEGALWMASIFLAVPPEDAMAAVAGEMISRLEQTTHWTRYFGRDVRAWWHYRGGRFDDVDAILRMPVKGLDAPVASRVSKIDTGKPIGRFRFAIYKAARGATGEAIKAFVEGLQALDEVSSYEQPRDLGEAFYDWYLAQGTRREAEEMFKRKGIPIPTSSEDGNGKQ